MTWGVHHYGIEGHRADKEEDEAELAALRVATELPPWPSGELVAPILGAIVSETVNRHSRPSCSRHTGVATRSGWPPCKGSTSTIQR